MEDKEALMSNSKSTLLVVPVQELWETWQHTMRPDELAQKVFEEADNLWNYGDVSLVTFFARKNDYAAKALKAYMALYMFGDVSIEDALRRVLSRLHMNGESQEIDRIVEAIAQEYCVQHHHPENHHSCSMTVDTVHMMMASMLLLNTDLHRMKSTQRMTMQHFISNTMAAMNIKEDPLNIRKQLQCIYEHIRDEPLPTPKKLRAIRKHASKEKSSSTWLTSQLFRSASLQRLKKKVR
jgi:Sec7-like guanine-nucleotide exchange factor